MRVFVPPLFAVAIAALAACGSGDDGPGATTWRAAARRAGVFVGAGFVEGSHTAEFREVLAREYNSVTAPLYWSSTEPSPGQFEFANADEAVELAAADRLRVRGHPLVWGRLALPDYVNAENDAAALRTMMARHVETVVSRYRGRIAQYDVVNEPMAFFGSGTREDGLEEYVFTRLLGAEYIRMALEVAHAADPDARLFVNELLVLRPGTKQDRFYDLVRDLVESGAPLHGVGFQTHLTPPFAPDYLPSRQEIETTLRRFADLGLAVELTEIDVTLAAPATQLEEQARTYSDLTAACLAVRACGGLTTWGISDAYTWIENFFAVRGAPLPFDADFAPKPAYFAVRDILNQPPRRR